jgi:hypothetical protein
MLFTCQGSIDPIKSLAGSSRRGISIPQVVLRKQLDCLIIVHLEREGPAAASRPALSL